MLAFTFEHAMVGIQEVNNGSAATQVGRQGIFSLNGVRMDSKNLPAGLYIVNGKKVVVK